jgi:crotonobetainyl-CoA:carnitine CoA-transferase CaiB-like acyl-CoA transferase
VAEYWGTDKVPTPIGSANRMSAPYQAFRAADRHFVFGAANQKLWTALCSVLERPDLISDERFATNSERMRNREALVAAIEPTLATRPADDWISALLAAGVPAAPILTYAEALVSEQAQARDMVLEMEHPVEGTIRQLGFPVKMHGTPQQLRRPPPLLGEHTEEIMREAGCAEDVIERLRVQGAFG